MKKDSITKLYENISNAERAVLAFHYMTSLDGLELDRVVGSVPVKTYELLDIEFRQKLDGICNVATLFAIEHWRVYAHSLFAIVAMHIFMEADELEKARSMIEANKLWESRLLGLDHAFLAICEECGLDSEAARWIAGAEAFVPMCADLKTDEKYQEEMKANFLQLLGAN